MGILVFTGSQGVQPSEIWRGKEGRAAAACCLLPALCPACLSLSLPSRHFPAPLRVLSLGAPAALSPGSFHDRLLPLSPSGHTPAQGGHILCPLPSLQCAACARWLFAISVPWLCARRRLAHLLRWGLCTPLATAAAECPAWGECYEVGRVTPGGWGQSEGRLCGQRLRCWGTRWQGAWMRAGPAPGTW